MCGVVGKRMESFVCWKERGFSLICCKEKRTESRKGIQSVVCYRERTLTCGVVQKRMEFFV